MSDESKPDAAPLGTCDWLDRLHKRNMHGSVGNTRYECPNWRESTSDAAPAQGRAEDAQIFVVDRAYEVMTDEQLANLIHGATHELYRRVTGEVKR